MSIDCVSTHVHLRARKPGNISELEPARHYSVAIVLIVGVVIPGDEFGGAFVPVLFILREGKRVVRFVPLQCGVFGLRWILECDFVQFWHVVWGSVVAFVNSCPDGGRGFSCYIQGDAFRAGTKDPSPVE